MSSVLVQPAATWSAPAHKPTARPLVVRPPRQTGWEEHAANQDWELAVLEFLRRDWRKTFRLWEVVNQIVEASSPLNRREVRSVTLEVLQAVMRLRRQKRVFRFRRKWLAFLDFETQDLPGVKPNAVLVAPNPKASHAYDLPEPNV
jgi:hypothetical protein